MTYRLLNRAIGMPCPSCPHQAGAWENEAAAPGTEVSIYRQHLDSRPIIEGRATLVAHAGIDGLPDLWRVRFLGEEITRLRLVHGGDWQVRPDAMLHALMQEWRLSLQPELLFENPFPERR